MESKRTTNEINSTRVAVTERERDTFIAGDNNALTRSPAARFGRARINHGTGSLNRPKESNVLSRHALLHQLDDNTSIYCC